LRVIATVHVKGENGEKGSQNISVGVTDLGLLEDPSKIYLAAEPHKVVKNIEVNKVDESNVEKICSTVTGVLIIDAADEVLSIVIGDTTVKAESVIDKTFVVNGRTLTVTNYNPFTGEIEYKCEADDCHTNSNIATISTKVTVIDVSGSQITKDIKVQVGRV